MEQYTIKIISTYTYKDETLYNKIIEELRGAYEKGSNLFSWHLCDRLYSVCTPYIYAKTNHIEFRASSVEELVSKALYYNHVYQFGQWQTTKAGVIIHTIRQLNDDDILQITKLKQP